MYNWNIHLSALTQGAQIHMDFHINWENNSLLSMITPVHVCSDENKWEAGRAGTVLG